MTRSTRCNRLACAPLLVVGACSGPELFFENDALGLGSPGDRYYTNGLRYQNTITRDDAPEWVRDTANLLRPFKDEDPTEIGFFIGQHIYTPEELEQTALILDDRPYAGWLYAGIARIDSDYEEGTGHSDDLTTMELTVGVIGPESQAEELQKTVHDLIGSAEPLGWDNQLDTEPTLMLSWMRQSRSWEGSLGVLGADVITHAGARFGTPYTDAEIGSLLRFGFALPKDFGVMPNEPSVVNPAVARRDPNPRSLYFFTGASGRGIVHNTFLDGNNFQDSHSVDKEPFVADLMGGVALHLSPFRLTYSWVLRTEEFEQSENDQVFGSLSLSWTTRQ